MDGQARGDVAGRREGAPPRRVEHVVGHVLRVRDHFGRSPPCRTASLTPCSLYPHLSKSRCALWGADPATQREVDELLDGIQLEALATLPLVDALEKLATGDFTGRCRAAKQRVQAKRGDDALGPAVAAALFMLGQPGAKAVGKVVALCRNGGRYDDPFTRDLRSSRAAAPLAPFRTAADALVHLLEGHAQLLQAAADGGAQACASDVAKHKLRILVEQPGETLLRPAQLDQPPLVPGVDMAMRIHPSAFCRGLWAVAGDAVVGSGKKMRLHLTYLNAPGAANPYVGESPWVLVKWSDSDEMIEWLDIPSTTVVPNVLKSVAMLYQLSGAVKNAVTKAFDRHKTCVGGNKRRRAEVDEDDRTWRGAGAGGGASTAAAADESLGLVRAKARKETAERLKRWDRLSQYEKERARRCYENQSYIEALGLEGDAGQMRETVLMYKAALARREANDSSDSSDSDSSDSDDGGDG